MDVCISVGRQYCFVLRSAVNRGSAALDPSPGRHWTILYRPQRAANPVALFRNPLGRARIIHEPTHIHIQTILCYVHYIRIALNIVRHHHGSRLTHTYAVCVCAFVY